LPLAEAGEDVVRKEERCRLLAGYCTASKVLDNNGAGEGNRTLVIITQPRRFSITRRLADSARRRFTPDDHRRPAGTLAFAGLSSHTQAVSEVTQILGRLEQGDANAADQLLPLVYEELRRLAGHRLAGEPQEHTLQATALVHEAWLKIAGSHERTWQGRQHFFTARSSCPPSS
jgi:hypothetical protein